MANYLGLDVATVALANIILQTAAYAFLIAGARYGMKRDFDTHKRVMRVATSLNILSLAVVMAPSLLSLLPQAGAVFVSQLALVHHGIGLVALVLALTVVVPSCEWIPHKWTKEYMLATFALWTVAYLLGLYVYYRLYF
jgi:uncharacterized membrane protein YozB (DUF420 family)